ncbi:unnamed protein product [Brassica napus]|uniref:(rape) hypothetical protein n=1 Tax=Brassica napus TaxID=3708 RepID=A0A816WX54_BRANA|nr:unnamed protein product [Brassica napus]
MEPLLGKQGMHVRLNKYVIDQNTAQKNVYQIKVFLFRIRAELSMMQCRESLKPDKM